MNLEKSKRQKAELIMLGTGHAMVTKCYNTCFAIKQEENIFLVDAGGGNRILEQMEKAELSFAKVHNMFVTHAHTDHILGVIWVIRKIATLMGAGKYEGDFTIYCHDDAAHIIKTICDLTLVKKFTKLIGDRILITPVNNGDTLDIDEMKVTFFDIWSTKTKQFGFRAVLKDQTVLTCLGDEPYNSECRQYVEGSDWLLSEAFCLYEERDTFKPYEKHHSTAKDAACLARELSVPNLLLYHTEDSDLAHRKQRYTEEAKKEYDGNVYVPDDLELIEL